MLDCPVHSPVTKVTELSLAHVHIHTHTLQTYARKSQNTVARSVSVITRPDQARYVLQTTAFCICHVGPDCNAY